MAEEARQLLSNQRVRYSSVTRYEIVIMFSIRHNRTVFVFDRRGDVKDEIGLPGYGHVIEFFCYPITAETLV